MEEKDEAEGEDVGALCLSVTLLIVNRRSSFH